MRLSFRCAVGALFVASSLASANTVYSNLGAGNTFSGQFVNVNTGQNIAVSFTPTANFSFDSAKAAFWGYNANSDADFTLAADNSGQPGTVLETFSNVALPSSAGLVTLSSASHPQLTAGATYWLTAAPGASGQDTVWMSNNTLETGYLSSNNQGAGWSPSASNATTPAFAIEGTPAQTAAVPLPSAALGGAVLLPLLALTRRRRLRAV